MPLLDVRAPIEFQKGAMPNSHNAPILDDQERAQVGLAFKTLGNAAATKLGHELVSGALKSARVEGWISFVKQNPQAMIMCWRGGQRSQIAQQWLKNAGYSVTRVTGGYKQLRQICLDTLDQASINQRPWWVIAGRTGVKKTVLIQRLNTSIDLEGIAHHRGSAFGAHGSAQPTPASFENALAVAYANHDQPIVVLEDESRTIGRLALPERWHHRMQQTSLVLIEASVESRVEHIVDEYIHQALAAEPPLVLEKRYRDSLKRISKRLGDSRHKTIDNLLIKAFAGNNSHHSWVHALLNGYYDPMYDYQLEKKKPRVKYAGPIEQVHEFLAEQARQAAV